MVDQTGVTAARPSFHLSLAVRSVSESVEFFTAILGAAVTHRDPSGYVNLDLFGTQLTLARGEVADVSGLHFGANLDLREFDAIAARVQSSGYRNIVSEPHVVDAGTPMERKKMYLKCPSGYLIELKGYR